MHQFEADNVCNYIILEVSGPASSWRPLEFFQRFKMKRHRGLKENANISNKQQFSLLVTTSILLVHENRLKILLAIGYAIMFGEGVN